MATTRAGRGAHQLKDIALPIKKQICKCEYCRVSAAAYELHGPIGEHIFVFRDTQLSHIQQVRIREIAGLNIIRMSRNTYIVSEQWMSVDDGLVEYLQSIIQVEPVIISCTD